MAGFGNYESAFDKISGVASDIGSGGADSGTGTYAQSPSRSSVVFGRLESALYDGMPYIGFQYFTRINFNGTLIDRWVMDYLDQVDRINLNPLVKSIDLPSMSIETDDLNEYNRHRLSQTRINYEPINMVIHDTVDGRTLNFWKMYYNYYFQDGNNVSEASSLTDINPLSFDPANSTYGYNITNVDSDRNLISSIDIFRLGGANKIEKVTLFNPRISKFTHAEMSYEKAAETVQLSFSIEYESVQYHPPVIYSEDEDVTRFLEYGQTNDITVDTYSPSNAAASSKNGSFAEEAAAEAEIRAAQLQAPVPDKSLLDQALDLKDQAASIIDDVAAVSALSGELNQLQRDLFGKPIVEVPSVNTRQFSTKTSTISRGYEDVGRVSSSATSAIGSLNNGG